MAVSKPVPWRRVWLWSTVALVSCAGVWLIAAVVGPRQPPVNSPDFRAGAGGQRVTIVENDAQSAYVKVQPSYGDAFYLHRDFVNEASGTMRSPSELFNKTPGEEYYFHLKEFSVVRDKIPGTFMTPSGRRVVGPWKVPRFEYDGEIAWPIYECTKADCPGRESGADHGYLFILPDARYTVGSDAAQVSRQQDQEEQRSGGGSYEEKLAAAQFVCPKCRERGRPSRQEALRQEFRRYELPEAESMWSALDDEFERSRSVRAQKARR